MKKIKIIDYLKECIKLYGNYLIQDRVLPDFRDGLKPSYRRLLWSMYKLKIHHNTNYKKCARVVGDCVGKYHAHSDDSLYDTLVNMSNLPESLIDGQGNFGSFENPKSYAAKRYTECRLTKYSDDYLLDPNYLAVVPFVDNYDGEYKEPVFLPAKIPNLFLIGSEGIAVGCNCLIPSFSKESVLKLTKVALKGKKITPKLCLKTLKFKFKYGGNVVSTQKELLQFYKSGKGTIRFLPDYEISDNIFKIKSLAPRYNINKIHTKIAELKGIKSLEDNCEGTKIKYHFIMNKNIDSKSKKLIINDIKSIIKSYAYLSFQIIIIKRHNDGEKADYKRTKIHKIFNNWVKWRITLEKKVVKRLIKIENKRLERLTWLVIAIDNKDIILKCLKSKSKGVTILLKKKLKISQEGSEFISNLKVKRLANVEKKQVIDKMKGIKKEIKLLTSELGNLYNRVHKQI